MQVPQLHDVAQVSSCLPTQIETMPAPRAPTARKCSPTPEDAAPPMPASLRARGVPHPRAHPSRPQSHTTRGKAAPPAWNSRRAQRDPMIALRRLRLHRRQIQSTPRSRIQNAHQRPLRIAITNVKSLHGLPLVYTYSSNTISDNAAPAGTIGKTLASGAQSKTSNSGSGDRRNRSIKSPVSLVTGYSRKASSLSRPALIRYAFAISTKSGLSLRSVSA